jgi:hypothetical protein
MKAANADIDIVVPKSTIFSEHPAVVIDHNLSAAKRPVVEAFLKYLWTDEAQKAFVKFHFRSVTNDAFNDENKEFAKSNSRYSRDVRRLEQGYPDIIEKYFVSRSRQEIDEANLTGFRHASFDIVKPLSIATMIAIIFPLILCARSIFIFGTSNGLGFLGRHGHQGNFCIKTVDSHELLGDYL